MTMRLSPSGFREYDARWRFPEDIDLSGMRSVGLALGTQLMRRRIGPQIILGHDFRSYSPSVKDALAEGLQMAGAHVRDIGLSLSPMAYFAQAHLDIPAVAMVTASHNPNGWTGVKMGFDHPCTHGPEDMEELREIATTGDWTVQGGGRIDRVDGIKEAYLADLTNGPGLSRPLKIVCATGNGTAGAFAPDLLRRLGAEVVERHCQLDHSFPNYNPNPEALEMLHDMAQAVRASGADFALGFDGDGDRCGVVDAQGNEVFADKMGLILARDMARAHPGSHFLADVKSTGLFATDPVLAEHGACVEYWKTGHSHMKRRLRDTGALAGFEKSGHYFIGPPIGRGYDCGLRVAVEICRLMDRHPLKSLSDLVDELEPCWTSATLSPACPDDQKYAVVARMRDRLEQMQQAGEKIAGRRIAGMLTVNGARVKLEDGSWGLIRASSNTPNLVVVCESMQSAEDLRHIFDGFNALLQQEPSVGAYDQTL